MRVSKSNVGDWSELKKILQYLYGALDLVLKLSTKSKSNVKG